MGLLHLGLRIRLLDAAIRACEARDLHNDPAVAQWQAEADAARKELAAALKDGAADDVSR